MKTLILDYSKWRCGADGKNKLGKGNTLLENEFGFQCCLGQFSLQINKELKNKNILNVGVPEDVSKTIKGLSYNSSYRSSKVDTALSIAAVDINDNKDTTPEEKIVLLKKLFKTKGFSIRVINKPK